MGYNVTNLSQFLTFEALGETQEPPELTITGMLFPLGVEIRNGALLVFLSSIYIPPEDFFLFRCVQLILLFVRHRVVFRPHLFEERDYGFGHWSHSLSWSTAVVTVDIRR